MLVPAAGTGRGNVHLDVWKRRKKTSISSLSLPSHMQQLVAFNFCAQAVHYERKNRNVGGSTGSQTAVKLQDASNTDVESIKSRSWHPGRILPPVFGEHLPAAQRLFEPILYLAALWLIYRVILPPAKIKVFGGRFPWETSCTDAAVNSSSCSSGYQTFVSRLCSKLVQIVQILILTVFVCSSFILIQVCLN